MLQYKIYLDIRFYIGRRGKEGLRELAILSFETKTSPEGRRYIVMTHKETTKSPRVTRVPIAKTSTRMTTTI